MNNPVQWTSPDAWRAMAPALHVEDRAFILSVPEFGLDPQLAASLDGRIREEGYFELVPRQWGVPVAEMAALVSRLAGSGIPTPFAYVFDEFWLLYCQLHAMISAVLGPGYLRLPDFWAWHVDPRRGEAGWKPHRDKGHVSIREDRSAKALTVWIPLSDATPMNGCMYIVPADRDPTYGTAQDHEWQFDLADIRALPARAGTIFAWTQAVVHWGGSTSRREARPRISAAMEFQAADAEPFNQPLSDPRSVPPFAERLRLIGKQILQYEHMYPLDAPTRAMAERLAGA